MGAPLDGLFNNRAGDAVRQQRRLEALEEAARLALQMLEEHGLDTCEGKPTHAAAALRAALKGAQ